MANKQFLKGIVVSNLAGSGFINLIKLYAHHGVERQFYWRAFVNALASFFLSILSVVDQVAFFFRAKPKKSFQPPLFIIGHWRSGTTHLHNLICLDERVGFSSTFQTVFPHLLFGFHKPLIWLMNRIMPPTRPVDDVALNANYPQEEEFGLANISNMSYYHWWYFPTDWDEIEHAYLSLENLPTERRDAWKKIYVRYVRRALIRQGKDWFVSKNPPHTARIKILLEIFPDARFVYIKRNPYEVFVSSERYFKAIAIPLQLQSIREADFDAHILKAYCNLHDTYESTKALIPQNRLKEICYEEFILDEATYLEQIYSQLEIEIPKGLITKWKEAIGDKTHKTKAYTYPQQVIKQVNESLGDRIEFLGYQRLAEVEQK